MSSILDGGHLNHLQVVDPYQSSSHHHHHHQQQQQQHHHQHPHPHHLLSPINYTLTAEAINRRIRSTLGLELESEQGARDPGSDRAPSAKDSTAETGECYGAATGSPDWMRRNLGGPSQSLNEPAGAYARDSPLGTGTSSPTASAPPPLGSGSGSYGEHKFGAHYSPVPSATATMMHDDNNNVDKKPAYSE
ncbi:transcription factor Sox-1-like [Anopheles albimanus]|nr:transcription factor Sox-1-like [Anopheles albimanus]XP_035788542.1 transcription factor Sox-1-like [Anopheles albimanus]XP_035788543.1 transcription factor Sox-1-like [Anopheles albimanus]XP_035788545.1 transcription factor Sox-1-like [Anopheles albimanus]